MIEEGISNKSKVALLIFLLAVLSTLVVREYKVYQEAMKAPDVPTGVHGLGAMSADGYIVEDYEAGSVVMGSSNAIVLEGSTKDGFTLGPVSTGAWKER